MPAMPCTTAVSRTVIGRSSARHVASPTGESRGMSAGAWVMEVTGLERRRRAAVRRIAQLTGTQCLRWSGEISDEDWQLVLTLGAQALLAAAKDGTPLGLPYWWEGTAREFVKDAAAPTVYLPVDHTPEERFEAETGGAPTSLSEVEPTAPAEVSRNVPGPVRRPARHKTAEKWDPFGKGPRHTPRTRATASRPGGPVPRN
ncbi:hypothetical protein AB0O91_24115 [Kitasatospora sp. NPDC089797]|uniref:hypothetical protein n=1 Tax=Kitasatospora sp. NPDC089797 TaxID=3155298 RepID=UPI00343894CF